MTENLNNIVNKSEEILNNAAELHSQHEKKDILKENNFTLSSKDISWEQLCERDDVYLKNMDIQDISEDQLLLSLPFTNNRNGNAEKYLIVANHDNLIPVLDTKNPSVFIYTITLNKNNTFKGIKVNNYETNTGYGLFSYIPFNKDKKIVGFYKNFFHNKSDDLAQGFLNCSVMDASESFQLTLDPSFIKKTESDKMSDVDKVIAMNSGSKIKKIIENTHDITYGDIFNYLSINLNRTNDFMYIKKMLHLSNSLILSEV